MIPTVALFVLLCSVVASPSDLKEETMEDIKAKAANGNPKAQESLAVCYEMGIGIPEDKVKATFWMRKAAEQGYPSAQWSLGS